jgi:hypothetical protein
MLDKQRTYMVLNYDTSPVAITSRYLNELIPAGNDTTPSVLPLSLEEIIYINSTTKVFQIGRLRFEPEFEEDLYKELRIVNWKDILTNQDIYDIILNPTIEKLERILAIDNPMYFDRIYGAYMGLKNAGATISNNVENIMKARYKELSRNKRKTEIQLRPKDIAPAQDSAVVEDLQNQLAETKAMLEKLLAAQDKVVEDKSSTKTEAGANPEATAEEKPKTTTQRKRNTSASKSSTTKNK